MLPASPNIYCRDKVYLEGKNLPVQLMWWTWKMLESQKENIEYEGQI